MDVHIFNNINSNINAGLSECAIINSQKPLQKVIYKGFSYQYVWRLRQLSHRHITLLIKE